MADSKLSWLEEVKADAKFNYMMNLRINQAKKEHEESKKVSAPVAEAQVAPELDEPLAPAAKKGKE